MTEQIRYRINRDLVEQAERVCEDLGLSPTQAVSLFFAQLVKLGALPFRPSTFPALDEYGATLADADAAEDRALKEIQKIKPHALIRVF